MATVSSPPTWATSTLHFTRRRVLSRPLIHSRPASLVSFASFLRAPPVCLTASSRSGLARAAAVAAEEELPATEEAEPVSVPVPQSDMLVMYFKAEGTMDEIAVSKVKKALGKEEGINDLEIGVVDGVASVVLTKETTVQATGVASALVEIIQASGFKLQTLSLSFEDEEDETDKYVEEVVDEEDS